MCDRNDIPNGIKPLIRSWQAEIRKLHRKSKEFADQYPAHAESLRDRRLERMHCLRELRKALN